MKYVEFFVCVLHFLIMRCRSFLLSFFIVFSSFGSYAMMDAVTTKSDLQDSNNAGLIRSAVPDVFKDKDFYNSCVNRFRTEMFGSAFNIFDFDLKLRHKDLLIGSCLSKTKSYLDVVVYNKHILDGLIGKEHQYHPLRERVLSVLLSVKAYKTILDGFSSDSTDKRMSPFFKDNKEVMDYLQTKISLFNKKCRLARRFRNSLLNNNELSKEEIGKFDEDFCYTYIHRVVEFCLDCRDDLPEEFDYENIVSRLLRHNPDFLKVAEVFNGFERELLGFRREGFLSSVLKYRTFLFRSLPTFLFNILNLKRFLYSSYSVSSNGEYRISIGNIPVVLGKVSPVFFDIFHFDFFFNFPLGIFLSVLDFCAYRTLSDNFDNTASLSKLTLKRFFNVYRPYCRENICGYKDFLCVVLKTLTNFIGVNFNIRILENRYISINLMSFVDDFVLREFFLDSFCLLNEDKPTSWSIWYYDEYLEQVSGSADAEKK